MKAVILAGGRGKRLGALTRYRPKPMLMINKHPFLEYIISLLKRNAFTDIVLCTGYLSRQIEEYFGSGKDFGCNINYSVEKKPLGTAGALLKAGRYIDGDFILLNGDTFADITLKDMVRCHYKKGNKITMAVVSSAGAKRYGMVDVDKRGRIINFTPHQDAGAGFTEKSRNGNFINAGIYVCNISLLEKLPHKIPASLESDVFPLLGRDWLGTYNTDAFFIDIGTVKDYRRLKARGLRI